MKGKDTEGGGGRRDLKREREVDEGEKGTDEREGIDEREGY